MKKNLLLLNLALIFLLSGHAHAQKHYNVEHYNGDNGLPQNSVKTISADAEGFIWLGTEDGLVRYNGNRFDVFNRFNLDISNTRVIFARSALRESPVQKKHGSYIEGRNAVSYIYFMGGEAVRVENGKAVRDTAYYKKDFDHLISFRKEEKTSFQSTGWPNFINGMLSLNWYMIRAGNTDTDFFVCEHSRIVHYQNWVKDYHMSFQADNLWNYFSVGGNIYFFDSKNASIISFTGRKAVSNPFSGDIVKNPLYASGKKGVQLYWNIVSDQAYLYIGRDLYMLKLQRDGTLTTVLLVEDFDLQSRGIEKIHYDETNGKIYLGSVTDGLFILSKHQFSAINIKGDFRDNVFYAMLPFDENTVLTADGRIVGKSSVVGKDIDAQLPVLRKINPDDKLIITKDRDGNVWIKRGHMLIRIDLKNKRVTGIWQFKYNIETIFYDDISNQLWVGSNQQGLFRLNLNVATPYAVNIIKSPFFYTTVIRRQDPEHLLVGTTTGLYRLNLRLRKPKLIAGTEKLYVKSIYTDAQKNIWFTGLERGLMLLKADDCLVNFPLDENKYLASPHSIMPEGNYLWIPTNKGLFQMTVKDLLHYSEAIEKIKHNKDQQNASVPSELFYVYHTKEEGFKTNEFNGCDHCGVRLANGNILLPSLNGLVGFRPGDIKEDRADGNIILDKAEVNRKTIIPSHDTLYFPMDPGQTKLHFSTAYFGNNYNLKLSYVLVKESRLAAPPDWIPMDKDLDIEFSSLNSGNYTLIIRKLNGFGINNYTIKKIYFIVPLKWYQTIWAEILLLFILIGLVYLYNWYSVRVVKRENIKLEELVSRRTSRLNQTLTDLEESKNEMSRQVHMLSRLLTSMTHDIQSPLNYIRLTSGNIPKMIQKAQYEDVAMLGEMIADSSGRMSNLLKGLLDYIKAHVFQNSLHYEAINLQLLVDEKFEIFKNMITENGSDFKNEISSNTVVYCDYQMLGIMIHNLIDNAAKFTRKGTIRIYFNASGENEGELVISNTTVGVPTEIQEMINTPETESIHLPMQVGQTRTSLGLLIVKEIAALVGVGLRVTQTDVTSFHLLFK